MKGLLLGLVAVAALALPAEALSDGHGQGERGDRGGNAWAAHACRHGGYLALVRSDGSHFRNVGACVRYAAHGGSFANLAPLGALSTADGFVIPAGAVATLSDAHWANGPCDALSYGYQLGSGALVTLASKPGGICENGNLPGATIGPFQATTVLRVFLSDTGDPAVPVSCNDTFYSNGPHALVSGNNPWRVDIRDSSNCAVGPTTPLVPAAPGQGNLDLTVSITAAHPFAREQGDNDQGDNDDQGDNPQGYQQDDHDH